MGSCARSMSRSQEEEDQAPAADRAAAARPRTVVTVGRGRAHARAGDARSGRSARAAAEEEEDQAAAAPRTAAAARGRTDRAAAAARRAVVAVGRRPPPPLRSAGTRAPAHGRFATQAGRRAAAAAGLLRRVGDDGRGRRRDRGGVEPATGSRGRPAVDGGAPCGERGAEAAPRAHARPLAGDAAAARWAAWTVLLRQQQEQQPPPPPLCLPVPSEGVAACTSGAVLVADDLEARFNELSHQWIS